MYRALVPATFGVGVGTWLWWWLVIVEPWTSDLALVGVSSLVWSWTGASDYLLWEVQQWLNLAFQLGGACILLHSWREIAWLIRICIDLVGALFDLVRTLISWYIAAEPQLDEVAYNWRPVPSSWGQASERGSDLTWVGMAAAVGAGAPPIPVGTFVLISRPPDWDEVYIAGYNPSASEALCRTTSPDGADWWWVMIQVLGLHMRLPVLAADGTRAAPHGVDGDAVNWICVPPQGNAQWRPSPAEIVNVSAEANLVMMQYNHGHNWPVNVPGVGGPLVSVQAALAGPVAPGGAGVVGGAGGVPVAAVLGPTDQGAAPDASSLKALEAAVQQLQAMALSPGGSSRKPEDKKKKKKSRKSKKKKKRSRSSSRSSASSSSSRSRSSRSSSSGSRKSKPLCWKDHGKDRKVHQADLTHVDMLKFKKRGDLVAFASRHPGALTAHFLAGMYSRLSKGSLSRSGQLREPSVTAWAHQFSGLTEIRDIKEVVTLSEVLDAVNRREIAQAMDIVCQRILAIQAAKTKGGSWEKAEAIELVNNSKSLASTSMLALTNA